MTPSQMHLREHPVLQQSLLVGGFLALIGATLALVGSGFSLLVTRKRRTAAGPRSPTVEE